MNKILRRIGFLLLLSLLLAPMSYAQSNMATLSGQVVDESGAALPGVTITATNTATGYNRVIATEMDGRYRFSAISPGTYVVTAELLGFATVKTSNVEVNVASERALNVTLKAAAVSEQITVTAEAPLVATSPAIGTVVSQRELENLPLNGRQFANLATLAPGTSLSVNADPTKPGQLTIALNGGSGRNVNFLIDGGDNTDDTIGGALQNFNLEAVQEFKIQTMQYKAEFGRSTGGVLSVVTKTGTNEFSGSAYEFARRDSFYTARTQSEMLAGADKQPYKRDQYGISFGGPIIRDKAHFFATWEKTKRDTTYTTDSGGIFPELDGKSFPLPFTDELGTAKATVSVSPRQFLQVRYGYQKNTDKYGAAPTYMPSALATLNNDYKSLLASHSWQIAGNRVNEALVQWTKFANSMTGDSNDPYLYFPSGVVIGQNINTPQTTNQKKWQFKDDFSWFSTLFGTHHDFKAGLNYVDEPVLGGDFSSGLNGQYNMMQDNRNSPVTEISIFGGFSGDKTPIKQYSGYFQDDWIAQPKLTINAGLRYDLFKGFDLDQHTNPVWQAFSSSTANIGWLKDLQGGKGGKLHNDTNNWAPRLGFTYDLKGNAKNLIRGGIGRYYDFPYTNATILFPAMAVQSNYGLVYDYLDSNGIKNSDGSFFHPGQPLPPNQLGNPEVPIPREVASPTLATPYSDQASLGYSWEVNDWLGLNFEGVSIRYHDLPYRFRANPKIDTNGDGIPDQLLFPSLSSRTRLWYGKGFAKYNGINIGFHGRMMNVIEMQGFYTYSKSTGNVLVGADEFRMWDASLQPGAIKDVSVNPLNPQCSACTGPLDTDARHRFTFSALYRAPMAVNISGIFRYHSGFPYTVFAGSDLNGDGYGNDLAPGVSHVNSKRGGTFSQFDLRLSREFKFSGHYGIELIAEAFNLFNSKNPMGYVGNIQSASFGQPTRYAGDPGLGEQRLGQLGLRLSF
jgi:Carboxypeptidase regulatory-like domain/TonB dependent receptor